MFGICIKGIMKMNWKHQVWKVSIVISLIALLALACSAVPVQAAANGDTKVVTDMAGREVAIPNEIGRIVTVGSVPAINSCLLAMGKGSKIVSGLPENVKNRCRYEYIFSPNIEDAPAVSMTEPDIEVILGLKPDVIFTGDTKFADELETSGIPVVCLAFSGTGEESAERIKKNIQLIGEVFNDTDRASRIIRYFDEKIDSVNTAASSIPSDKRPRVLYANMKTLTAPYLSSEWCIKKAGGIPVSDNGRVSTSYQFNEEELLKWNPDIIIVLSPDDISRVYDTEEYNGINAVKNKQVYITPSCMGYFGGSSPEMPIAVKWMASKFYPDRFSEDETNTDITDFYKDFYDYTLSESQLKEILGGLQ